MMNKIKEYLLDACLVVLFAMLMYLAFGGYC